MADPWETQAVFSVFHIVNSLASDIFYLGKNAYFAPYKNIRNGLQNTPR